MMDNANTICDIFLKYEREAVQWAWYCYTHFHVEDMRQLLEDARVSDIDELERRFNTFKFLEVV